jgi:type II secretory pathway pseudopilin PulG
MRNKNLSTKNFKSKQGFTLIETLISVGLLVLVSVSFMRVYTVILRASQNLRLQNIATFIANSEMEIIRNLPYADVGVSGSIPDGVLADSKTVTYNGINFLVIPTIRNIDDPFDGTIGGTPNDLSPADSKLVELEISCVSCDNFTPFILTTRVSPKNLETASDNGALRIQVFDAQGQPVSGADVTITNTDADPDIVITDTTDIEGELLVVDAPPGTNAYEVIVSKAGYSTDQTYNPDAVAYDPEKPNATVALQNLTQTSFAIDQLSSLNLSTVTSTCSGVGLVDYQIYGSKLIGTEPDTRKYSEGRVTNSSGSDTISDLEWDTYFVTLNHAGYDLIGVSPLSPFELDPGASQDINLVVRGADPNTLVVTVVDIGSGLPLSDAIVTLENASASFSEELTTGKGSISQTTWIGGGGQDQFNDNSRFYSSTNVEYLDPSGQIVLRKIFDDYVPAGELVSSTIDLGISANLGEILWSPEDQPVEAGASAVRFQLATNNDETTWDFVGPDGTNTTYYSNAGETVSSVHDGDRYLRYKAFLSTADTDFTPNISDISFTFTADCTPPGQVAFSGLSSGDYDLTITRSGYTDYTQSVSITDSWQQYTAELTP